MKRLTILLLLVLMLGIGIGAGWLVWGRNGDDGLKKAEPSDSQPQEAGSKADGSALKSLASYSLPDGWQEASCDGDETMVYVLPQDVSLDCAADPSAPISISLDARGTTDCDQLDGQQNVRRHVCKSLDINGNKSLEASTTLASGKTTDSFYIDSDRGVIKAVYQYEGQAAYQEEFELIVKSIVPK